MTAVDTLISDLRANRQSSADQPLVSSVDVAVAALQQLASGAAVTLAGDASGAANANQVTLTHLAAPLPIAQGGTAGATAAAARTALSAAQSGVNADITSLTGLTTPLPIAEGGTAAITAALALVSLGAAPLLLQVNNMIAAGAAALYKVNRCDATAGAFAVQLPAPTAIGDWCHVRKASTDATTNRVTVQYLAVDQAWLTQSFDEALFYSADGVTWAPLTWNIAPLPQAVFTSSGTWTKPPLAKSVQVICIGAGAGGGSGRRGAAGSARQGGSGGTSGVLSRWIFNAADLLATETVTIGASGTGGAAQTVDSTDGNPGTVGGNTTFGAHLSGVGGNAGGAGSNANSNAATSIQSLSGAQAVASSTASVTAAPTSPINSPGAGTGGTGGGITTGNADFSGSTGGQSSSATPTPISGGAGGANAGNNPGTAGTAITDPINQYGGSGGGGGGGNAAGVGGNGGIGGAPGGAGAGGGASVNTNNSGAGGNGSRGELRIATSF